MSRTAPLTHEHSLSSESAPTSDFCSGEPAASSRQPVSRRAALFLLKAYQGAASGRVSACRYYPSCSNYAVEAFSIHGFWRALSLTARRLLRCRPFGPHGVDLVPLPAGSEAAGTSPTHPATQRHIGGRRQAGHPPGHSCDQELEQVGTPC